MSIRVATCADASAVAALLAQLGYPCSAAQASQRIAALVPPDNVLLVATLDEEICGLIGLHLFPALHCDEKLGKITVLVVDAQHRGQGIGTALLHAASAYARSADALRIEVLSGNHRPEAHRFYQSAGYTPVDQTKFILTL